MKRPCVEFYRTGIASDPAGFAWRLRAKNGQVILSPHESFISHRNAVASFKRVCDALDPRGVDVYQVRDLEGIKGDSLKMLEKL